MTIILERILAILLVPKMRLYQTCAQYWPKLTLPLTLRLAGHTNYKTARTPLKQAVIKISQHPNLSPGVGCMKYGPNAQGTTRLPQHGHCPPPLDRTKPYYGSPAPKYCASRACRTAPACSRWASTLNASSLCARSASATSYGQLKKG